MEGVRSPLCDFAEYAGGVRDDAHFWLRVRDVALMGCGSDLGRLDRVRYCDQRASRCRTQGGIGLLLIDFVRWTGCA